MVLLDNPQEQQQQSSLSGNGSNNSLHPLLSPQHLHPNAITTPANNHHSSSIDHKIGDSTTTTLSLPVTSTIQYPVSFFLKVFCK